MSKILESPRRRSARTTLPSSAPPSASAPSASTSILSSASSTSSTSGRERSTRSAKQASPPTKATTPTTSDNLDSAALMSTRRSTRRQLDSSVSTNAPKTSDNIHDNEDEDIVEDEETTRCVCEFQDYPGPPLLDTASAASSIGNGNRSFKNNASGDNDETDANGDEPGSLFIQCDECEVWQHGGCVGIMYEADTPDNYFCEQCRPDFHTLAKTANGQKYSRYVPIASKSKSHRKLSGVKNDDVHSTRDSLKAGSVEAPKRRSTMNSRATLGEDELLRKALEISKQEGVTGPSEPSVVRKSKRGREESHDVKADVKRQRTNSSEPSQADSIAEPTAEPSIEAENTQMKTPHAAGQSLRGKPPAETNREREHSEIATKKKSRRRGDEHEALSGDKSKGDEAVDEEEVDHSTAVVEEPVASTPTENTPQPTTRRNPPNSRKRGRGGRSTILTPREGVTDVGSPAKNGKVSDSPKEISRDGAGSGAESSAGHSGNGNGNGNSVGHTSTAPGDKATNGPRRGRPGRDRNEGPREPTMLEMRRRATAMQDYIAKARRDMAEAEAKGFRPLKRPFENSTEMMNGTSANIRSAAEMAEDLTLKLFKWQQTYGDAPVLSE